MTTSIEDELALLVAAERDRPEAGAEAADRVWSGVQARLDGGPPPASVPPGTRWGMLSLVGGLAVVGLAVGGWFLSQPQDATRFEPVPKPTLAVVAQRPEVPALHTELPEAAAPEEDEAPAKLTSKAPQGKRENAGTVADELALIEKARTALDRGQAKSALGTLATHRRQFPKGAFLEEAAALRASALCTSGKVEAAQKASATFLRRYPNSVHANRVKQCE